MGLQGKIHLRSEFSHYYSPCLHILLPLIGRVANGRKVFDRDLHFKLSQGQGEKNTFMAETRQIKVALKDSLGEWDKVWSKYIGSQSPGTLSIIHI